MRVYVAGALADTAAVRQVQNKVSEAGHTLTLDWTAGLSFSENFASRPETSTRLARETFTAVLEAEAVVVVASRHDGRGMFVELGAALARAEAGALSHVVVVGSIQHESVFYFHPCVRRVSGIEEWLRDVT